MRQVSFSSQFSEELFNLELEFTNTRCLVPVNLRKVNAAIVERNMSDTLSLAPSTTTVKLSQARDLSDGRTHREGLRVGDLTDDLEVHRRMVANRRSGVKRSDCSAA